MGVQANPAPHHNYRFENNLYRFRGRMNVRDYHNYDEPTALPLMTDPNLALGRLYGAHSAALVFSGRASQVTFASNWITTWPSGDFFHPSPGNPPPEQYRVIWVIKPNEKLDARIGNRARHPPLTVTLQNSRVSGTAFEFARNNNTVLLPEKTGVTLAYASGVSAPYGGDYSAGYQNPKSPASTVTFAPKGRVERVRPIYDSNGQLSRVREIVLGTCTLSGNQVQIQARVLDHYLPHTALPGTIASPSGEVSGNIYVRADFFHNGQKLTLNGANQTDANPNGSGVVQKTVTLMPPSGSLPTHGVVRVTAWINNPADAFSAPADLNEDADAWASLDLTRGTVVTLDALPDVGDDKNTGVTAKRAKFLLKRNGTAGTLNVKLRLRNHKRDDGTDDPRLIKPDTSTSIIAAYGNTQDYHLSPSPWPTSSQTLPYETTVSIPNGQSEVVFTVVPKPDNLTENNVIVLQALPDSTYSVGLQDRAEVLLYDGPEYTLYELSLSNFYAPTTESVAYAINNKSGATEPRIAGMGTYQDQYGLVSYGGWWQWPNYSFFNTISNLPYYGISTSPVKLVGGQGTKAYVTTTSPAGFTYLSDLYTAPLWQTTTAWGINPSATYIVGSSKNSAARRRPVAWSSSLSIYDLGGPAHPSQEGHAKAVNDQNQFAGQFEVQYTGGSISRFAFRTKPGAYLIEFNPTTGYGDILHAVGINPSITPLNNREGEVTWVVADGRAVGWSRTSQDTREATYWDATLPASSIAATRLSGWQSQSGGAPEAYSAAQGINANGWIVGWSGISIQPVRAVLKKAVSSDPKHWLDLNDRHFTHGPAGGWVLKSADAINDLNYIVCNGTLNGEPRAFLLVPRTPGN